MPNPDLILSVIIVNWNTRDLLAQCLASVFGNPPASEFEVIVVDNASSDCSTDMVRERFPQVILIENGENVGFSRANNQALRRALEVGSHILFLNSDTLLRSGAIDILLRVMEEQPHVGAVGPKMLNPDGTIQNSYGSLPSVLEEIIGPYIRDEFIRPWGRIGRYLPNPYDRDCQIVKRVSFACTLVRDKVVRQVGFLDESFAFYSEDYDFFKRLADAHWDVLYCPEAEVTHYWGASSSKRNNWALRQLYRSKRIYFEKHHGKRVRQILDLGLKFRFSTKLALTTTHRLLHTKSADEKVNTQRMLLKDLQKDPYNVQ